MDKTIEFGTHRMVTVDGNGKRTVKWARPPLSWSEFFSAYAGMRRVNELLAPYDEVSDCIQQMLEEEKQFAETGVRPTLPPLQSTPGHDTSAVLQKPLVTIPGSTPALNKGVRVRRKPSQGTGARSLGQYVDFRGKPRSLPKLNGHTIRAILYEYGALNPKFLVTEDWLSNVASCAGETRRNRGFGGGNPCSESVELYVRVFRALGATLRQILALDEQQLVAAYEQYVRGA